MDKLELIKSMQFRHIHIKYNHLNLNIDLVKFNRYLPWGLESRGLISGSIDIEGKELNSTFIVVEDRV